MTAATVVQIKPIRVAADIDTPHHRQAGCGVNLNPLAVLVRSKRILVGSEEIEIVHKAVVVLLPRLHSR